MPAGETRREGGRFDPAPWIAAALSAGVFVAVFAPLEPWLRLPFLHERDGLWNLFVAKTVAETGWYGSNPALGAPLGATFLDLPKPEVLFLGFFRLVAALGASPAQAVSLFYALGFPLVAASAAWVLRRSFSLGLPFAVAGAVLYAWIPFHVLRMGHLFLGNHFAVPLAIGLLLGIAGVDPAAAGPRGPASACLRTAAVAFVIAGTSSYWVYFTSLLGTLLGLVESLRGRSLRPLARAAGLVLLLGFFSAIHLAPSLLHRWRNGKPPEVLDRSPAHAEILALRPVQLVLPLEEHRIPAFGRAVERFRELGPALNENRTSALGLLGTAGFLLLLARLLVGTPPGDPRPALDAAARLNGLALAVGVTGGIGTLVAFYGTPLYRAMNRISVFIAFLALAAFFSGAQRLVDRRGTGTGLRTALAGGLLLLGLLDQIPGKVRPDDRRIAARVDSDRAFVRNIEARLPAGSAIFQVPYSRFPEPPAEELAPPYDALRPYLQSSRLRWSYGAMRGSEGDLRRRGLAAFPLEEQVAAARSAGFAGIVLDRAGLLDRGAAWEAVLRSRGAGPPIESHDGTFVFYPLSPRPPD